VIVIKQDSNTTNNSCLTLHELKFIRESSFKQISLKCDLKVISQSLFHINCGREFQRLKAPQLNALDPIVIIRTLETDKEDLSVRLGCKYEARQRDMRMQDCKEL